MDRNHLYAEPVIDRVVREINICRRFMPIIYIETQDRHLIYEILEREDCFEILQRQEDGTVRHVRYTPQIRDANVVFIQRKNRTNWEEWKEDGRTRKPDDWEDKPLYYCVRDFQIWDSSEQRRLVERFIERFVEDSWDGPLKKNLILLSAQGMSADKEEGCVPPGYEQYVRVIDVPLIGMREIIGMVVEAQNRILRDDGKPEICVEEYLLDEDGYDGYAEGFKGMNRSQIRYILSQLRNKYGVVSLSGLSGTLRDKIPYAQLERQARALIYEQKCQQIAKSGDIRYLTIDNLVKPGGMEGLGSWIRMKKKILDYPKRANAFHMSFPKGVLIAGLPGSGKSLMAKYVAHELDLPLIQFKMDMVLQGYIGASEQRLNQVLKLFEASAPCVIWLDEIEKELAGMQGSGEADSGVNKRCLARLLNWLQEKRENCFICATANYIDGLPSELFRRGRFDRLYYTFLPLQQQCVEIVGNHFLKLRQENPQLFGAEFTADTFYLMGARLLEETTRLFPRKFFVGADLEGLIQDAKAELFEDMDREPPYSVEEWEAALRRCLGRTITYAETNFEDLLDYWLSLKEHQFRNAAVPDADLDEAKYRHMLFDFSDLEYDGSGWSWRKGLKCCGQNAYDQNMFRVLTEGIQRKIQQQFKK